MTNTNEPEKQDEDQKKEAKEIVIRAPQSQVIPNLIMNYNIPLLNNKQNAMNGRKTEEQKAETTKKVVVRKQTQALFLQNNQIRSIANLAEILIDVMWTPKSLIWLDLSNNYLETIEDEFSNLPQLKTLYLHGNYFSSLDQVRKLNQFDDLQTLTLYGAPIEQIKNYRMYVLGMMYEHNENLRKFDQVLVTNREFDKVLAFKMCVSKNSFSNLKKLKPSSPIKRPPQLNKEEDEKKNT